PDDVVRAGGRAAFAELLGEARPLAELLWSRETTGMVFDTPERRAGLEQRLREVTGRIRDESLRRHYQQDMRERVNNFFVPAFPRWQRAEDKGSFRGSTRPGGIAASRLAVSESLTRSALVKSSGALM